jgi:hypothetical protein
MRHARPAAPLHSLAARLRACCKRQNLPKCENISPREYLISTRSCLRWRHSFKAEENGKRDAARNRRWLCRALRCCSCGAWYHAALHAPLRSRRLSRRVSLALPMRSRDLSPVLCPSLFRRTLQTPPSALRACSPLGPDSWLRVDARPRSRASLRARQGRRTGCHGAALMEGW